MTFQPILSEFPYIWEKFRTAGGLTKNLTKREIKKTWLFHDCYVSLVNFSLPVESRSFLQAFATTGAHFDISRFCNHRCVFSLWGLLAQSVISGFCNNTGDLSKSSRLCNHRALPGRSSGFAITGCSPLDLQALQSQGAPRKIFRLCNNRVLYR